jgi:DNA-binding response OmpR family regulator
MKYKILLIEDDATMLKLLQTYLQFEGFEVIMPGKDDDLVQTMESIRQEMPAVVLLDVYMHKFNGIDLLCVIRQDEVTKNIGVIVSSGADFGERCVEEGADSFILKPFMPEELIKSIHMVIAKRATPTRG